MKMWTKKYRPESYDEIYGNQKNIKQIKKWADNWNTNKKPLVLYGQPGTGKTTTAYCVGYENNWEIMEMNASDKRTGTIIDKLAGEASKTASLFGDKRKLIIIDEADNIHGTYDRGGQKSVGSIIKTSKQPIILICNDFYDLSRSIRNNVNDIEFKSPENKEIAKKLRDICDNENISYSIKDLKTIARNSNGDVRAAINDLQKYANNRDSISLNEKNTKTRNQKEQIFGFLDDIFKKSDPQEAKSKYRDLDMNPSELIRWIKQNISNEFSDYEYYLSINYISKADKWLGRVQITQNYKFWKYAGDNMSAGISASRKYNNHSGWTRWQPPRYQSRKEPSMKLLRNISKQNRVSIKDIRNETIPYISELIHHCKPKELTEDIVQEYDVNKSDLSTITGSGKNTNKVKNIIESKDNKNESDTEIKKQTDTIVKKLTNIDGIGTKTAKKVSTEIETFDDVKLMSINELTDINGISKNRAKNIREIYGVDKKSQDDKDNEDDKDTTSQPDIDDFI